MNIELQNVQFLLRKDAVTYTVKLPAPLGMTMLTSTEASIRSRMATPVENWGNADVLVDVQACVDAEYLEWGFTVVQEPAEEPDL
jgi:hypothetical protein